MDSGTCQRASWIRQIESHEEFIIAIIVFMILTLGCMLNSVFGVTYIVTTLYIPKKSCTFFCFKIITCHLEVIHLVPKTNIESLLYNLLVMSYVTPYNVWTLLLSLSSLCGHYMNKQITSNLYRYWKLVFLLYFIVPDWSLILCQANTFDGKFCKFSWSLITLSLIDQGTRAK